MGSLDCAHNNAGIAGRTDPRALTAEYPEERVASGDRGEPDRRLAVHEI